MRPTSADIKKDIKFRDWLSYQPSCIDGSFSEIVDGVWRNVACHVRRVGNGAGTARKPLFSAVPMNNDQHTMQHMKGELALLNAYGIAHTREEAKQWFEEQARKYLVMWTKA
jgi:hypothetical protein